MPKTERRSMSREAIKKRLARVREQKEKILKLEAELVEMEREADDAASMKIIRKERISPERLIFLKSISEPEIKMLMESREEKTEAGEKAAKTGGAETDPQGGGAVPDGGGILMGSVEGKEGKVV